MIDKTQREKKTDIADYIIMLIMQILLCLYLVCVRARACVV